MIARKLRRAARAVARRAGFEVCRSTVDSRADLRLVRHLAVHRVSTVLDVGANRGQFAGALLRAGFPGRVVSFEAIPEVHRQLTAEAAAHGDRWLVAPCCALGDRAGEARLHVTNNLVSSSLLAPNERSNAIGKPMRERETIAVDVRRLDDMFVPDAQTGVIFLKIDVQGAEPLVLEGAARLLPGVQGLLLEMTVAPLYDGQMLADELHALAASLGFGLWDQSPVLRDARTARLLQYDATYFRDAAPASS